MLFSILLLIHFIAFAFYVGYLALLWPVKGKGPRSKAGFILGMIILLTGILMVMMIYPNVNYYKVVPKTAAFLVVTVIYIFFEKKELTTTAYYSLIGLTLLAGCIAIFH
ncbi:hypothetical protein [Chitinophaga silvisoli]|uniref:Uncharacterized protein n=1 Tax=Chitinophaga silvisoli TaxID=2291814 RepID=A0A3E1NVA9_9BACT|nr:hypothetical protein [Chitinophaga silvisoli]RFM31860.1 hypothetical protein DXN04_27255 [Chitinophaga silvisoli]